MVHRIYDIPIVCFGLNNKEIVLNKEQLYNEDKNIIFEENTMNKTENTMNKTENTMNKTENTMNKTENTNLVETNNYEDSNTIITTIVTISNKQNITNLKPFTKIIIYSDSKEKKIKSEPLCKKNKKRKPLRKKMYDITSNRIVHEEDMNNVNEAEDILGIETIEEETLFHYYNEDEFIYQDETTEEQKEEDMDNVNEAKDIPVIETMEEETLFHYYNEDEFIYQDETSEEQNEEEDMNNVNEAKDIHVI
jgi:hypothetical protein